MLEIPLALTGFVINSIESEVGSGVSVIPLMSINCGSALGSDAYCWIEASSSAVVGPLIVCCNIDISVADDNSELGVGAMLGAVVEALGDVVELVVWDVDVSDDTLPAAAAA